MGNTATRDGVWTNGKVRLLVIWFGLDALLYLGAVLSMVLAISDASLRPLAYGFTIALVASWALRMAYGIWLELHRVRAEEREKARRLDEILKKHGLTEEESASVAREIKGLG